MSLELDCRRNTKFGTRNACIFTFKPTWKEKEVWTCPSCGTRWQATVDPTKGKVWHWPPDDELNNEHL